MATNKNRNHSNPPPHKKSKKSKPADKMNVDNRDSLSEFQSSIFDASDGHQLVDFIRKKKGLRAQPQKIFDDVPTNRQSLHIEIQRLDEHENETTQPDKTNPQHAEECENQATNENNTQNGIVVSPKRMPIKSPMHSKTLFKRLSQSIGRRTLLKEFEKTLQESRFLPPTCSTPLTGDLTPNRDNTIKEKIESVNQGNLNIVCTPITITDEESPNPENRSKTTEMAKELEEQVDFVLERSSNEKLLVHDARAESEDDLPSSQRSITLRNRTTTPKKAKNRQTYTIERDDVSGNLILSPSKSTTRHSLLLPLPSPSKSTTRHSFLTKTPERRATTNMSPKLVVTPKQKQLLLSKFGRSSQVMVSPQKAPSPPRSRIPILVHGNTATNPVAPESDPYVESANLSQQHPETVKIIEQLQRKNTSNAPVIVIPVNQTFNQAPNPESAASATFVRSPRPLEPVSTSSPAKSRTPQLPSVSSSSSSSAASTPIKMNSLRLKDILTDDESSDYHPNFSRSRKALRRKSKKSLNNSHSRLSSRPSNLSKNKLSLTAKPTLNASKVREVLNPQKLSRMSECEILDLRKRNSRGELRRSMNLTQRESSLLGKQMELELLRRNIQEKNYEDEVLQMEVIPPPPDEFCDRSLRRSQQEFCDRSLERSQKESSVHVNDEFVDEMSGDRVSLNRRERLSKSIVSQKPTRKKKKVLEHVERYLETSQKIQKSKFMNLSKRKLYNKGNSEECSSTDSQPLHKPTTPKQTTKRKSSQRKSTNVPSTPSRTQTQQSTQSPSPQRTPISSQQQQRKSNEFVNKTVPFLPQTNEVSAKPEKKKPKNNKKPKKPLGPVDPDRGTSFVSVNNQENLCRRSKREKKLPTAYWSSTQTEFRPLYDYHDVVNKMYHNNKKKPPTSEKTLVANTKTVRAGESTKSKKTSTKQHNQQRSSKQVKSTKEPADDASWENEIAANSQYYDDTNDLPQQKNSKSKSKQSKAKRDENEFSTQQLMDDPFPNITSEADVAPDPLPEEIEATLANNETNRTSLNFSKQPTVKLNPLSKSILSASVQASSGYSSDVSSVQQIRLATIDEDSVPTVHQANLNSTMASASENRLSRELMPPPPSTKLMRSKKSSSKVKNSKRSAFRTEHDKSIADVSSDHLNKLFDQLKNSSVSTSSEVAASIHQNNYSGQASAHPRPTESNSILERKCKKFSVRLQRMKAKEKSTYRSEKVCDSGFSSEDMSSVPKQKGDVLLNWLKQMIVNNKTPSGADKGVARILQSEGIHTSSVEDLIFQEIDGVEYAFYDTKAPFSIGYIRFNPKTGKKKSTAKKFELNFVILSGKVNIAVNDTKFDCKNGDLITVFIGTSYVIQNTSNDPALVMVIKK